MNDKLETEANHLSRPEKDKAVDPARARHSTSQRLKKAALEYVPYIFFENP